MYIIWVFIKGCWQSSSEFSAAWPEADICEAARHINATLDWPVMVTLGTRVIDMWGQP